MWKTCETIFAHSFDYVYFLNSFFCLQFLVDILVALGPLRYFKEKKVKFSVSSSGVRLNVGF